jgi:hypothetical protein
MKRTNRTAASGLNLAQTRAIGRMTINFNWMEHGAEVLIRTIVSVSPEKMNLMERTLKRLGLREKLAILRGLVADLPDHYAKTAELDRVYAEFAAAIKSLSKTAKRLNNFRNHIVHWRPWSSLTRRSSRSSPPPPQRRSTQNQSRWIRWEINSSSAHSISSKATALSRSAPISSEGLPHPKTSVSLGDVRGVYTEVGPVTGKSSSRQPCGRSWCQPDRRNRAPLSVLIP